MDEKGAAEKLETHQQLFKVLDSLNRLSHGLRRGHHSPDSDLSTMKALAELRTSNLILTENPHMVSLSHHLSKFIELVQELQNSKRSSHGLKWFLICRVKSHEISRLTVAINSELHDWIGRETVSSLTRTVAEMRCSREDCLTFSPSSNEDALFNKMTILQDRLSRAFDMNLQDVLLRSGIFSELEWILHNPVLSERVREKAAISMKELVLYNKDVFVGSFLVGGSVKALVSMGSLCSLHVLSSLIKAIRSPLVDEMESCGGILKIISFLSSDDLERRIMAMECAMEIGYYGRKEAVETMLKGGLIKRLVELQKSELGGDLIDVEKRGKENECGSVMVEYGKRREMKYSGGQPFATCVARFAVQLEVGEGLRQGEKQAFKQLILDKVREAAALGCVSGAESATIVAEVLWGSSP